MFVGYPVYSLLTVSDTIRDIRGRGEPARLSSYRETTLGWVFFAICLTALWVSSGRAWSDLGIRLGDLTPMIVSLVISIGAILIIVIPLRNLVRHPENFEKLESQIGEFVEFMPRTHREPTWFSGMSVSAGITEELIFRGYLIWYLNRFFSIYWAAGIAVIFFAFAHSYKGLKQLPGILLISTIAVGLYLFGRGRAWPSEQ